MNKFMRAAIEEAEKGMNKGYGGPFGAVIVKNEKIIGRGNNQVFKKNCQTMHSAMIAMEKAGKQMKNFDLSGCEMYVTDEPCPMCLCAAMWANLDSIYYGCSINDSESIGYKNDRFNGFVSVDKTKLKVPKMQQIEREACLELFKKYANIKTKKR